MKALVFLSAICIVALVACDKTPTPACDPSPNGNLYIYSVGYHQSDLDSFIVSEYNSTKGTFSNFVKNVTFYNPTPVHNSNDTFLLYQTNDTTDFRVTMPSNGRIFSVSAMGYITGTGCTGPIVYSKIDTQTVYGRYLFLVK